MNHSMNDQELVARYLNGDESCLETLINKHQNQLFSYILNIVKKRELAEDIFQDTFIKVIKTLKRGNYKEEGKFLPWVMRIAYNLIIDYFRVNKRLRAFDSTDDFDIFKVLPLRENNAEEYIIKEQITDDMKKLIECLPLEQQETIKLRFYDDLSFKEIAEQTNVNINTALGRMRYALINLRKLMKEKDVVLTS